MKVAAVVKAACSVVIRSAQFYERLHRRTLIFMLQASLKKQVKRANYT